MPIAWWKGSDWTGPFGAQALQNGHAVTSYAQQSSRLSQYTLQTPMIPNNMLVSAEP